MRHTRRAIAILAGFGTGFIAAATAAYAAVVPNPPLVGDQWWNATPAAPSTSAAGLPLWQFLEFVALGVLMAVAIVGLGYALSHSWRSQPSSRSQTPLRS
jgi:hypothetical protein